MRHQNKTVKLGRSQSHRDALLANQICSLIEHSRIKTTLAKAKAVRPLAERMVTLGKKNTLHARRTALAYLRHNEDAVKRLFEDVAPRSSTRNGGYTRIVKLGYRQSDAAPMAFIEWVDAPVVEEQAPAPEETAAKKTKAKKSKPDQSDATGGTAPETAEPPPKAQKPRAARSTKAASGEENQTEKGKGQ
jgi:large subunit ribosomal protein L17